MKFIVLKIMSGNNCDDIGWSRQLHHFHLIITTISVNSGRNESVCGLSAIHVTGVVCNTHFAYLLCSKLISSTKYVKEYIKSNSYNKLEHRICY